MDKPYFDEAFKNYWYDDQLVGYITQFMAVFSDMYVKIGNNDNNSQTNMVKVPIRYGGVDRVVEHILSSNTTNKPLRLPLFSAKLVDLQPATDRYKGLSTEDRYAYLPRGESLPDGVKVVRRKTPMPYRLAFELNIFTSNDLQKFQILEQILTIFDPYVQIQTSDQPFDGGKITVLELSNIGFEENYPSGPDKKINVTSIIFTTVGWLQVPLNFKENFVKSIHLRLQVVEQQDVNFEDLIYENLNNPSNPVTFQDVIDTDNKEQFPNFPPN